jgi:cellulase
LFFTITINMLFSASTFLALLSILEPLALAHNHIDEIWANGVHYPGFSPNNPDLPYPSDTPGWYTTNLGGNPLYPIDANQNQIICAKGGSPANISAPIAPGQILRGKWWQSSGWPVSHHGPVIDYIAVYNADPTKLKFVKIAQRGWINNSTYDEGFWASDQLIADDNSWNIKIPNGLKAGKYVVRTEIIALHLAFLGTGAYSTNGAEFYPQCINVQVSGTGTKTITGGVDARTFYTGAEPGLFFSNLHTTPNHADYVIPGPALWSGTTTRRSFTA